MLELEKMIFDEQKARQIVKCLNVTEETLSQKNNNYASDITRMRVTVELGSGVQSQVSFIAKRMPDKDGMRQMYAEFQMKENELFGYDVLKKMTEMMKERRDRRETLWAKFFGHTDVTFIFEDLTVSGYEPFKGEGWLDENHSVFVLSELARYHAMGIALIETKMVDPTKCNPHYIYNEHSKERFFDSCITTLRDSVANWGPEWNESVKQLSLLADNFDKVIQKTQQLLHTTLHVIGHCDAWRGNMLFKNDVLGRILSMKLVDFQVVAHCSYIFDLYGFLCSSVDPELIWNKLDVLLRAYRESLVANMKFYSLDSTKAPTVDEIQGTLDLLRPLLVVTTAMYWPVVSNERTSRDISGIYEKNEGAYRPEDFSSSRCQEVVGWQIKKMLQSQNILSK